jgi:hypothetical protein
MLAKCANPVCRALFRRLGSGKLFAFEPLTRANIASRRSGTKTGRSPVFFWLCQTCRSAFTLRLDAEGELLLQPLPNGARAPIFDGRLLDHGG